MISRPCFFVSLVLVAASWLLPVAHVRAARLERDLTTCTSAGLGDEAVAGVPTLQCATPEHAPRAQLELPISAEMGTPRAPLWAMALALLLYGRARRRVR